MADSKTILNVVMTSTVSVWNALWTIVFFLPKYVFGIATCVIKWILDSENKCFILSPGNTLNADKSFINDLRKQVALKVVDKEEECDFILFFCPIVSRAGTDIEAALEKLQKIPETKPVVVVVLHHTYDPDLVVPDSSRVIRREKTITVDVLFFENQGLLRCTRNSNSLARITNHLKRQGILAQLLSVITGLLTNVSSLVPPSITATLADNPVARFVNQMRPQKINQKI